MILLVFALLGLNLAAHREGVWKKYTPEDVARWREAAGGEPVPPAPAAPLGAQPIQRLKPRNAGLASSAHAQ